MSYAAYRCTVDWQVDGLGSCSCRGASARTRLPAYEVGMTGAPCDAQSSEDAVRLNLFSQTRELPFVAATKRRRSDKTSAQVGIDHLQERERQAAWCNYAAQTNKATFTAIPESSRMTSNLTFKPQSAALSDWAMAETLMESKAPRACNHGSYIHTEAFPARRKRKEKSNRYGKNDKRILL